MRYIDDLSFSNIVNLIQHEEKKGADVLNSIANEMEENDKIIKKLENDLYCAKNRKVTLFEGAKKVMTHLKKEYPLAVQRKGYVIVVTEKNISIERNIL
jgi:hypothetical protein